MSVTGRVLTSVDDIALVEVVYRFQNLFDSLRCIFFSEFTILANSIEKLAARCELRHNIEFILDS